MRVLHVCNGNQRIKNEMKKFVDTYGPILKEVSWAARTVTLLNGEEHLFKTALSDEFHGLTWNYMIMDEATEITAAALDWFDRDITLKMRSKREPLKDHQIARLATKLQSEVKKYIGAQCLRTVIARLIVEEVESGGN